ncbi:MAG: bacteriohemerythrin [Vallitaleaceae bacterium]|nr:bacteriohemerythrin [Vallitaleaceae bacterium]
MLNYTWSMDYSVQNSVLDDHHKNLLKLFNDAYDLIISNAPVENTIKLLSELKVYSIFHFSEEEKLMRAANYPYYEEHVKEHKKFIEDITKFKDAISEQTAELNEEIFLFLSDWLIHHIQKTDRKYIEFL